MTNKPQTTNPIAHPFKPISNERSHTLILGTMPSVQSRKAGFYYSHPRNRFWLVLARCLGQKPPESVADKKKLLLQNGIAIWDVLAACEIIGSDDASIQKPIYNDIATLVSSRPITKILCNGKKAYSFCRHLDLPIPVIYVPSTSPANAAWGIERLIDVWKPELVHIHMETTL